MRAWLGCLALAACGRINFDATNNAVDGDASPVMGRFGTPVRIDELGTIGKNEDPSLTGDMLELYFNSDATGAGDIYVSKRAAVTDPWGAPQLVVELSSSAEENTPEVSLDGLTFWLSSKRTGSGDYWVSTRATRTDPWGVPQTVPVLSMAGNDVSPFALPDQLTVYVVNNSSGEDEIYRSTRSSVADPWPTATLVTELSHPAFDSDEWVSTDDLTIYWASERITQGDMDLWRAKRPAPGMPFSLLEPVTELNTSGMDEDDPWLSPDGHTIYFSQGSGAQMSIFMATR